MIAKKYRPLEKIGEGTFCVVFKGENVRTNELVAIKFGNAKSMFLLKHETTILNYLYHHGCLNVPTIYWYGIYKSVPILVTTLYDYSLTSRGKNVVHDSTFFNETVKKLLTTIQSVHNVSIIHRDIKPDNIMFKHNTPVFIDFGFAISCSHTHVLHDKEDNDDKTNSVVVGSPKYASLNVHKGIATTKRDDMISLGYTFLYMLFGKLEWSDNLIASKSLTNIRRMSDDLTKSSEMMHDFEKTYFYLETCYQLSLNEEPVYRF